MSYETNPITNRLKINKGWKNPHFPTKTINYSREMLLWFKIYLLLKAYLYLHHIQLLACEIRISEANIKILYLSVNKTSVASKTNFKSKLKSKSYLRELNSPLTKAQNKDARFLLYQDFKTLKKTSTWNLNTWQKKILSKAWISKHRMSSWSNLSNTIYLLRKKTKFQKLFYQKQKQFYGRLVNKDSIIQHKQKSFNFNLRRINPQNFWRNKQKKVLSLLTKIQKEIIFLRKSLQSIQHIHKINQQHPQTQVLIQTLISKYEEKKLVLKKVQNLYNFWFYSNFRLKKNIKSTKFQKKIWKLQTRVQLKSFWLNFRKQLNLFKQQELTFENKKHQFMQWQSNVFIKTHKYRFLIPANVHVSDSILKLYFFYGPKIKSIIQQFGPLKRRTISCRKQSLSAFLFATQYNATTQLNKSKERKVTTEIIKKNLSFIKVIPKTRQRKTLKRKNLFHTTTRNILKHKSIFLAQTRLFTRKITLLPLQLARFIRFKQKRKLFPLKKKKKIFFRLRISPTLKNLKMLKKTFQYRTPYRQDYKQNLMLLTNFKLKYLIQDFVQKYFSVRLYVKLIWPLTEFKNLKFYRLVFPKYQAFNATSKKLVTIKYSLQKTSLSRRYMYIGRATNHLELKPQFDRGKKKQLTLKKIKKQFKHLAAAKKKGETIMSNEKKWKAQWRISRKLQKKQYTQLKKTALFSLTKPNLNQNIVSKLWLGKTPKKNAYLISKLKIIKGQSERRLNPVSKLSYMPNLLTTLALFAKYLDPQALADSLAKIIGTSRKHSTTLRLIETVLRTLNMKRSVGYRIGLIGRADGANKSRAVYLKKLNRNRSRLTFSKNVNFAMSQARAKIGAFGVKVWVYF